MCVARTVLEEQCDTECQPGGDLCLTISQPECSTQTEEQCVEVDTTQCRETNMEVCGDIEVAECEARSVTVTEQECEVRLEKV